MLGTLCWGSDGLGQLGRANGAPSADLPNFSAPGLNHTIASIASGSSANHTCAILDNGQLSCWGRYGDGELGDGTSNPANTDVGRPTPSMVVLGPYGNVFAVAAGASNTCAIVDGLDVSKAVSCWGDNAYGQLSNYNSSLKRSSLVTATPIQSGAKSIAVGSGYVCALAVVNPNTGTSDTGVWCWGKNDSGQLGRGVLGASLVLLQHRSKACRR